MEYLNWGQKKLENLDLRDVADSYNEGYVFTRIDKGDMYKTRSLRIDLSKFSLHTKNKRVLRITEGVEIEHIDLPLNIENYDWHIHQLGKDYYAKKFGEGIFSASKIKELITNEKKSHYNKLLKFTNSKSNNELIGYCIVFENEELIHYAYPFYDLEKYFNHYGMGMMLRAILYAKELGKKYFYIGSVSRPADIYKLYFRGLEWFDGSIWSQDIEKAKALIAE